MIGDTIQTLRKKAGYSQAELARKLSVTRSSVNAWESGLSSPTAAYIVDLAKLFHVTADYILGLDNSNQLSLAGLTEQEIQILYSLLDYFDKAKEHE